MNPGNISDTRVHAWVGVGNAVPKWDLRLPIGAIVARQRALLHLSAIAICLLAATGQTYIALVRPEYALPFLFIVGVSLCGSAYLLWQNEGGLPFGMAMVAQQGVFFGMT